MVLNTQGTGNVQSSVERRGLQIDAMQCERSSRLNIHREKDAMCRQHVSGAKAVVVDGGLRRGDCSKYDALFLDIVHFGICLQYSLNRSGMACGNRRLIPSDDVLVCITRA